MLFFIGLGLYDEKDISVKGLEAVLAADEIYAEFYTSRLMGASVQDLERIYGKKVTVLSRKQVENDPSWLENAREMDLAFLVGGDPMVSTTHLDLRLRALEMGIGTKIIHSSSIVTAISGLTGLQNYRFSKSTTIPFPYFSRGKRIVPDTPYMVLKENQEKNCHTMIFLDILDTKYMTINEGAGLLMEMAASIDDEDLDNKLSIGIARAGSDNAIIKAETLGNLKKFDFGDPLHILIVPAKLHFMEAKALEVLANAPQYLIQEAIC